MRVVFDSNIYVSAFVVPGSQAEQAILKAIDIGDTLIISKAIIDEVLSVLAVKFSRDKEALSRTALYLSDIALMVKPTRRIKAVKDDPDNRILECAVAGGAEVIVSGDKALLGLGKYEEIRIVKLREYIRG